MDSGAFEGDDSGTLYNWSISSWFTLADSDYDISCFNNEPLEFSFHVVWQEHDVYGNINGVSFYLEDPVASENAPNIDQGGPPAPNLFGGTTYEEQLTPALEGSVSGEFEIAGDNECVDSIDSISFDFTWSFDKDVYDGPGYQTLE